MPFLTKDPLPQCLQRSSVMGRILAQGHEQGCKRYLLKVKCLPDRAGQRRRPPPPRPLPSPLQGHFPRPPHGRRRPQAALPPAAARELPAAAQQLLICFWLSVSEVALANAANLLAFRTMPDLLSCSGQDGSRVRAGGGARGRGGGAGGRGGRRG